MLAVSADDHILDVGSGIGGPARFFADQFACRVTGIDLTAEFCEVARHLTGLTGLDDRVICEQGNALEMPFDDGTFDGAYSMNVSMNIEDKDGLYREIHRVLKPGAWLALSELAQWERFTLRRWATSPSPSAQSATAPSRVWSWRPSTGRDAWL